MYKSKLCFLLIQFVICTFVSIQSGHSREIVCTTTLVGDKIQEICQPVCDENCVNGICDYKARRCICKKGYHPEKKKCQPDCAAGCPPNSTCIEGTNNCSCNKGYTRNAFSLCEPFCYNDCGETGYCAAPDKCACKTGYIETNNGCVPICPVECGEHEHCGTPNNCVCNDGYERNTEGKCSPACDVDCGETKFCSAPNICECKSGFFESKDGCLPICLEGCGVNEHCVAPNKCACVTGYRKTVDNGAQCEPVCDAALCGNATCLRPGICECAKGYARLNDSIDCLPHCVGGCGPNGICAAAGRCECVAGYLRNGGTCVPHCKRGCGINAHCTAPDVCQCMVGFENKTLSTQQQRCQPICEHGCPLHAYCAEPNYCSCITGYIAVDDICVPHCKNTCDAHSKCIAPDRCHCDSGFLEHDGKCLSSSELKSCMKDILFINMRVSCDTGSFIIYLIYGAMVGSVLICTFITYKCVQLLRNRQAGNYRPPEQNYVITYQPRSREDEVGVMNEDRDIEVTSPSYSQPPAYNTLTRKC